MEQRGLENATIHVGGEFWRALGRNGALIIGYALIAIHVAIMTIRAVWVPGMSYQAEVRWDSALYWSTVLGPLLAMCFLFIGELIRRGDWEPAQSADERRSGSPSNTVHMRMVPLAWHVLWGAVAVGAAGLMLWVAWTDPWSDQATLAVVNGIIAAGVAGAIVGSGVKKFYWFRVGRARQNELADNWGKSRGGKKDLRRAKFWRLVGLRWRYDLWSVGLGMVVLWLAGWALVTRDIYGGSTESATITGLIGLGLGAAMVIAGLWATTQFWRSGEDLATAESVA